MHPCWTRRQARQKRASGGGGRLCYGGLCGSGDGAGGGNWGRTRRTRDRGGRARRVCRGRLQYGSAPPGWRAPGCVQASFPARRASLVKGAVRDARRCTRPRSVKRGTDKAARAAQRGARPTAPGACGSRRRRDCGPS